MVSQGRGGYREGSGRPSPWNLRPITVVKIPLPLKDKVLDFAHKLDNSDTNSLSDNSDLDNVTIPKDYIDSGIEQILRDVTITRNGKDKAAVKRALLEFKKLLLF